MHFVTHDLTHLLAVYGYWAVLLFVVIESVGVPFPGETMLLAAAIYAGTTHHLFIPFVIAAAAVGAILGDNVGFWIGREGGYRLLRRYGRYVRIDERKMKLGQYLFRKHGGKVVLAVIVIIAGFILVRRNEKRLEDEAERAMPGPLDQYQREGTRGRRHDLGESKT